MTILIKMEDGQRFFYELIQFVWIYVYWFIVPRINFSFIPSIARYSILIPYGVEEMYKTNIKKLNVNSHG